MTTDADITPRMNPAAPMNPVLDQVPFMSACEWKPTRTGDYATDCAAGRHAAECLVTLIQQTDNPALFGTAIRAIIVTGKYEAVEIGFCSVIGITLTQ